MKAKLVTSLLVAACTALTMSAAQAVDEVFPERPDLSDGIALTGDETPTLWFVELTSEPTSEGTAESRVVSEQAEFRAAARASGLEYTERFAFQSLFNGLSIEVPRRELAKLSRVPGVQQLWPVIHVKTAQSANPVNVPDIGTAVAMTGADIAQSRLGLTGWGVKVAVMDTGVDYDHPDLGGCFGKHCRVMAGFDFVGDDFNADEDSPDYNPVAVPDKDPDDCNGHGTHVAGIIGARPAAPGGIRGVAPGVRFGAYRVFGCDGATTADIMLAAMERAQRDGMDVLNMSIGAAFQWPQYPTALAADRLVRRGMVVVASIGNEGATGLYSASAPGLGSRVIGVASYDNTFQSLNYFTVSPDATKTGYTVAAAAPNPPTSGTQEIVRTGTATSTADACAALPAGSRAGKVVLIRRGGCGFYNKAFFAQSAGAASVVLYNNAVGRINPTVAPVLPTDPPITIPVVAISDAEGVLIDGRLATGPVTITWTDQLFPFPNVTSAGLISSFSSYGLGADLSMKPDLGAPGGFIRSTYPLEQGGTANISGTSMASPHVAGAAALLLQSNPFLTPDLVQTKLLNSADPKVWSLNAATGLLDHVHRQGAGMVDVDDSILATTLVTPAQMALGEGESGAKTRRITLQNFWLKSVTYNVSYEPALSTGGVITPTFFTSDAVVTFSKSQIKVKGWGDRESVDVTIAPATQPVNGQYGGYIVFTPTDGGKVYRVPFAGFVGDYQGIQVLTPTANGFPWLVFLQNGTFFRVPDAGRTYTLANGDNPIVLAHFEHQSRRVLMDVYDAANNKVGSFVRENYFGRNSSPTTFFAFEWDGTLQKGSHTFSVADGVYTIRASVLKALGDPANPAHTEGWTSPPITIDRP
jgi:minor extracellular serine protease Vpr